MTLDLQVLVQLNRYPKNYENTMKILQLFWAHLIELNSDEFSGKPI